MIKISNPGQTAERVTERLRIAEQVLADCLANGWVHLAKLERRRIAGLKGTLTRINRDYFGAE